LCTIICATAKCPDGACLVRRGSAPGGCLTMAEVEHVVEVGNVIGEGPLWHSQEGCLYWVNFIEQFNILRFSPRDGRLETFETGVPVMALGIRKSGGFIAAT